MFFAYIVMLLAMLYETIFFIALLVGFICGHALFSVYLPHRLEASSGTTGSRRRRFESCADDDTANSQPGSHQELESSLMSSK
jgi:hypothetical protein